jgi:hypothetical protein
MPNNLQRFQIMLFLIIFLKQMVSMFPKFKYCIIFSATCKQCTDPNACYYTTFTLLTRYISCSLRFVSWTLHYASCTLRYAFRPLRYPSCTLRYASFTLRYASYTLLTCLISIWNRLEMTKTRKKINNWAKKLLWVLMIQS